MLLLIPFIAGCAKQGDIVEAKPVIDDLLTKTLCKEGINNMGQKVYNAFDYDLLKSFSFKYERLDYNLDGDNAYYFVEYDKQLDFLHYTRYYSKGYNVNNYAFKLGGNYYYLSANETHCFKIESQESLEYYSDLETSFESSSDPNNSELLERYFSERYLNSKNLNGKYKSKKNGNINFNLTIKNVEYYEASYDEYLCFSSHWKNLIEGAENGFKTKISKLVSEQDLQKLANKSEEELVELIPTEEYLRTLITLTV